MGGSGGVGYLMVLLIGAVIVFADGRLILRHSPGYLLAAYRDPRKAKQVVGMVGLFFHLVMFGVVLLVVSDMEPLLTMPALLRRVGVMLILTAFGHAITMVMLSRLRDEQIATDLANAGHDAPAESLQEMDATPSAWTQPWSARRTGGRDRI